MDPLHLRNAQLLPTRSIYFLYDEYDRQYCTNDIGEASGTTIAILYVSDLVWQWFWIFGFYGHAMAILRLYRDIKDRHTFLERNRVVFGLCLIIAAVETAICGWSRTALGLTWPGMLVQFAMRGHQQQVAYSLTFALVVTMRIFLDGWIAMELYRTFRVLQQLPYTCCHHKQMGARFYRVFTAISYIFLIANDTIAVGLVPLPSANASLDGVPLRLLGIARFNGGAFAMLFTWSVLLLYVHLPPTVLGVCLPWIVALAPDPAAYQEKRAPQRSVSSEWELSAHSASQAAPWPADALDAERELRKANLYYQTEQEALRNGDSWLSRSLVLETHVLIFNMAYLSYRPWHDPHMYAEMFNHYGVGEMDPLQARVVRHISSAVTDVHVLVIDLADRIVVSFRGTKSTRNLRTDMNVRRVPLEEHLHARECPQIQDTWRLSACSKHGQRGSLRESPAKATVDGTTRMPRTTNAASTTALAAGRSGISAATCSQIPPATHSKREIDSTRKHQASVEAFAKDDSEIERGLDDALSQELGLDPGGRFAHRRWWQYMLSVRGIRSLRFGDFRAQAGEDFSYLIGRRVPTKVHDGFLHAYLSVREELMETLKPLVAKPSSTAPTAVDAACAPLSSTCGDATCGVATSLDRRVQPSNRFPKVSSADIHGGCEHGQQQQQLSLAGTETAARCRSETATAAAAAADASEAQSCSAMNSLDSASCNHKPVIF
jgi:hypothetical protein